MLGRGTIGRVNQCDSLCEKKKKSLKMRGLKEERNMTKPVRVNEGSKKKSFMRDSQMHVVRVRANF